MATYSCTSGYMLSGNRTRQCQPDGSWSGEMPQCIRTIIYLACFTWIASNDLFTIAVDCEQLEHPVDGQVIATATTFGSIASYMCREGHILVNGSTNRTCQADAHWSGTRPTCIGGKITIALDSICLIKFQITYSHVHYLSCCMTSYWSACLLDCSCNANLPLKRFDIALQAFTRLLS